MDGKKKGEVETMSEIATAYVQLEPTFKGVQEKISKELGGGDAGEKSGKEQGSKFGQGFASVIGTTAKVVAGAVAAGATAVGGVIKESTANFAEYEQLVGGVETLFGRTAEETEALRQSMKDSGLSARQVTEELANMSDGADIVMQNAARAYATAGMSANEYMETVTSFSASLLQSLGGDTMKAANTADMAIADMSDNANKMGSSMESIQNAYQGFAKQNYTMLDNLKLGYGGTKTEMERLLADASKLSGIKYDISSLDDVYNAIHVIQENMGITGTTAKEASTTIQGSLASLQASWANVLTGMGDKNSDLGALIGTLVENAETFIGNLLPVIEQALTGVSTLISELAPVIAEKIPGLLQSVLPMLLTSGVQIIQTLGQGILDSIPVLMPTITDLIVQLGTMLVEMLPQLIEVGMQVILQLALGIAQALPELIPTIVDVVLTITQYLIDNIDLLIDAAIQLMIGLTVGLVQAIPLLIEKVPVIISSLLTAFSQAIPKLVEAGKQIINVIKDAIGTYGPVLLAKGQALINDLKAKIMEKVKAFMDVGKNIVEGIKKGISDAWEGLKSWFTSKVQGLVDGVKDFFKIGSPSKLMANEVGQWIPAGIAEGIESGMGVLDKAMDGMSTNVLARGIDATVSSVMDTAMDAGDGASDDLYSLLSSVLPRILDLLDRDQAIEIDGQQVFRVMQRQARRNTELVGTKAALSGI